MSDPTENKTSGIQFNNLFSRQGWKESKNDREVSPDFRNWKQEFVNKNTSKTGGRNNFESQKMSSKLKEEKSHKPRKVKI